MHEITQIGHVESKFKERADPFEMRKHTSTLIIDERFQEGLFRLNDNKYIQVVFYFHQSPPGEYQFVHPVYSAEVKGVFASRSPRRPSLLGVTTVELLKVQGNRLLVQGLDAIDQTPILDIKPYSLSLDETKQFQESRERLKQNPRADLIPFIRNNDLETLLIKTGMLHGHFCPGLAMGVMAGTYLVNHVQLDGFGFEKTLAIVEINSCATDGIQMVTGCSFGNNSLIYRDYGKTAFSLVTRDGKGLRLISKPTSWKTLDSINPEFNEIFTKVIVDRKGSEEDHHTFSKLACEMAFEVIKLPIEEIFAIQEVSLPLPPYAPIKKTIICDECHEGVMDSKIVQKDDRNLCLSCAQEHVMELNGFGIQ